MLFEGVTGFGAFQAGTVVGGHGLQEASVIDTDREIVEIQFPEDCRRSKDEFYLSQVGRITEDIDIALSELAVSSLLRSVGTPNVAYLHRKERRRKLC